MTKKSTPTRARKTTSSNCTHTLSNMGGFSGFCGVSIDQFPQVGGPVSFWAASPALPGYKLRRITEWMAEHLADEFSLPRLAGMAGLSEFNFNRLFKRATGTPPSRYQIKLRIEAAQRLLRETSKSVITVANEVGYSNPSHFAQAFRKETGLSPRDYRRDR